MTDKEKAKAYDEALSKCKAYIDDTEKRWSEEFSRATEEVFKEIFPELRESEDERIINQLITLVNSTGGVVIIPTNKEELIAWLEKQKEQKPVEIHIDNPNIQKVDPDVKISTSDSSASGDELLYVSNKSYRLGYQDGKREAEQKPNIELIQRSWYMEGYHDREFGNEPKWVIKTGEGGPKHELNPRYGQPLAERKPAEWSEEDEQLLGFVYDLIADSLWNSKYAMSRDECLDRLTSLRQRLQPRPSWKPSEEQMKVDLEKETRRWWKEHLHLNTENQLWMDAHQSVVFARHFAEWQKAQMLKDAVEGKVYFQMGGIKRVKSDDFENPDIHLGDKVRLIIVKEDEE